jgi:hypothetical protein
MKTILLLVTTLALATTSFANLGETLPELKHRFTDSKYTTKIRGGVTVHIFTDTNRQVIVELIDGVSVSEIYNMNSPFSPAIYDRPYEFSGSRFVSENRSAHARGEPTSPP